MKKMSKQAYAAYVKEKTPVHNVYVNMAKAFVTGGTICLLGQVILNYCKNTGMKEEIAGSWTSLVLVLISVLLPALISIQVLQSGVVQERLSQSRDLPILWQHRRLNIRKKDRYLESDVRFLR